MRWILVYGLTLEALGPTSQFFISPCTENIEIPSVFTVFVKGDGNSDKIRVAKVYVWTRKSCKKGRMVPPSSEVEPTKSICRDQSNTGLSKAHATPKGGPKSREPYFNEGFCMFKSGQCLSNGAGNIVMRPHENPWKSRRAGFRCASMMYWVTLDKQICIAMQHRNENSHKNCIIVREGWNMQVRFSPHSSDNAILMRMLIAMLHGKHFWCRNWW